MVSVLLCELGCRFRLSCETDASLNGACAQRHVCTMKTGEKPTVMPPQRYPLILQSCCRPRIRGRMAINDLEDSIIFPVPIPVSRTH